MQSLTNSRRVTHQCVVKYLNLLVTSLSMQYQGGNISSRFSSNSEADDSELLENIGEMFPRYYISKLNYVDTQIRYLEVCCLYSSYYQNVCMYNDSHHIEGSHSCEHFCFRNYYVFLFGFKHVFFLELSSLCLDLQGH